MRNPTSARRFRAKRLIGVFRIVAGLLCLLASTFRVGIKGPAARRSPEASLAVAMLSLPQGQTLPVPAPMPLGGNGTHTCWGCPTGTSNTHNSGTTADTSDLTVTIPQNVLNQYAAAVGTASGSGVADYYVSLPVFSIVSKPGLVGANTAPVYGIVNHRTEVFSETWTWSINNPQFCVTNNGIAFTAFLLAQMGNSSFGQAINAPVKVSYNSVRSWLIFTMTEPIPVFLGDDGVTSNVGTVDPYSYYSTTLTLAPQQLQASGGVMTGSLGNNLQLSYGSTNACDDNNSIQLSSGLNFTKG